MSNSTPHGAVQRFGNLEVDPRAREIRWNGSRVRVQDQPLSVLLLLLERRGEVVTREELKQRLWSADTFVDADDGINTAIRKLREVLAGSADSPISIETIPRRGYRLAGVPEPTGVEQDQAIQVRAHSSQSKNMPASLLSWTRRRPLVLSITLALAGAAAVGVWLMMVRRHTNARSFRSIAVLPFSNLSDDPRQEYFAEGMTDTLITNLAQMQALRVVSRTSAMHYKNTSETLPQIARELKVDAVVEGSVQRSGNRIQVSAKLIPADTDAPVWASAFDRNSQDVLQIQRELAEAIADEIELHLTPGEQQSLAASAAIKPEAYNAYLLGIYFADKRDAGSFEKAFQYFHDAIASDPAYARAYAGLANAYFERDIWGGGGVNHSIDQIRAATSKALQLDPNLAEGHLLLARIHLQYDWDWPATESELKRVIELNPNLAGAYEQYAYLLEAMGRLPEALAAVHRAVELDPLSAWQICNEGRAQYRARQFDKAIASFQHALEIEPGFPPALSRIEQAYEQAHDYDAALTYAGKMEQLRGDPHYGLLIRARIDAQMGNRQKALQELHQLQQTGPIPLVDRLLSVYCALGDRDRAIDVLEKAIQSRSILAYNLVDPELDPLRGDPRFKQLLHKAGLPD